MKPLHAVFLALSLAVPLLLAAGCGRPRSPAAPSGPTTPAPPPASAERVTPAAYTRNPDDPFQAEAYQEPTFQAQVADYRAEPGFRNVGNWDQFSSLLDAQQQDMLARNMFVVTPAGYWEMPAIYEENNYRQRAGDRETPSVVTVDSVLHTFHCFYDYTVRAAEYGRLSAAAGAMTRRLLEGTLRQAREATDPDMRAAALKNAAYLLVPATALGIDTRALAVAPDARRLADAEWALVERHEGKAASPLLGTEIDYSQFTPRGHYTRSDRLRRYFVAMMWYGNVPLVVRDEQGQPRPEPMRQAALLGQLLTARSAEPEAPGRLWQRIYEPTAFLVGYADDLTPAGFLQAAARAAPGQPVARAVSDPAAAGRIAEEAARLAPAQIVNGVRAQEVQVRLMGQRFVLDSFLLQQLLYPSVGTGTKPRVTPKGLDVFAALGSDRALALLRDVFHENGYENYDTQMAAMREYVRAVPADRWQQNAYWGWLDVLRRVAEPKGDGYPAFMRSEAWQDRSLNAGLASWAQLRHDTILYAKQSAAEGGEGGALPRPEPPKGYVEPDLRAYHRLQFLHAQLGRGLKARGLLDPPVEAKFRAFDNLLAFLVAASRKELANQPLSAADEKRIHDYGEEIASLNLLEQDPWMPSPAGLRQWEEITTPTDSDMALAADVHTGPEGALEECVGHPNAIYVLFPSRGKVWVGRGAVYTYYEFNQPAADRLTDEKWQEMVRDRKQPPQPSWVSSFQAEKPAKSRFPE